MPYLKYYSDERIKLWEYFGLPLQSKEATEIVIDKLLKHFKLGKVLLSFTSGRNHSYAGAYSITINTSQLNFGVICHELAHVYQKRISNGSYKTWHNKFHNKIMKRMLRYCEKKNWFEEELKRRLTPKPVKLEPTEDEIQAKKIEHLLTLTKKYERKLKLYSTKLKKTQRKLSRLQPI